MLSQGQRAKLVSILGILRLDITYENLSLLIPALEILPGLDWEPVGDFPFDWNNPNIFLRHISFR